MWVEIFKIKETFVIKKNNPLGFVIIKPEHLKFNHEPEKTKNKKRRPYYRKPRRTNRESKMQCGGFLNRYDFPYAGRDTINQAAKVAPGVIKAAADDINEVAEQRIIIKSFQEVVQKWRGCL